MDPRDWQAPLAVIVGALFLIVMARANATYWLGRAIVAGTARSRWARVVDSRAYRVGADWLNRWGAPAVTVSFLTIGVQTMVNLAAGVTRMPLRRYVPAVTVGCVIWALMYGTVGFVGFVAVERMWAWSPSVTLVAGLALAAALVVWVVRQRVARQVAVPVTPR